MVPNQPSGNFIRAAGSTVLCVGGNDETITSGSSELTISCDWGDRGDSWYPAEVIERSTMVFTDHISHNVLENRTVPWGGFRTPRRERLAADITIMSMLYESSAIISVNCFLYLYQYFYTRDNSPIQLLQSFALHSLVPLIVEWFFTSVSISVETRYQNMPVMAVWRRRWRRHILVAVINMVMISIWTGTSLLIVVEGRFTDKAIDYCKMPFSLGS